MSDRANARVNTWLCPICARVSVAYGATCPRKPADRAQAWECEPPHVTGAVYVARHNAGVVTAQAAARGIAAIMGDEE